jgi:protein-S-isoprenylcysteine O-methyltransferase Ste14
MREFMSNDNNKLNTLGKRGIFRIFSWILFKILLLFGSAGSLVWLRGWIYISYLFSYQFFYILTLMIVNPMLLNERGKFNLNETKHYDKYFIISCYILVPLMLIVAGLDFRFQWSSIPFIVIYPCLVAIILTSMLALWAHISNSHFILTSRDDILENQQVFKVGPYKYIRHPGYLSAIIQWVCYPILLGSLFSLIPALIYVSSLFMRTYFEDKTLRIELKGYEDYSKMTNYRLLPHIW